MLSPKAWEPSRLLLTGDTLYHHPQSESVPFYLACLSTVIPCNSEPSQPSREDSNNASRLSTPLQRIKLRSDSRPPTPGSCQPTVAHAHALHPKQPVRTRQQLYDRLALIDRSVAHGQDAHFRHHLLRVSESQDTCDRLLSRIDQVDTAVASMLDKRKSVEDGGKCLQDASQKFDKQVRITSHTHTSRTRR
jgi:conserved oligomeric Golgi complex subunit 3